MRILRHYTNVPAEVLGGVVAIGNFDGVHRGHQAVIDEAGRIAERDGAPHVVLTFEPHPRHFFNPGGQAFRLTSLRSKAHQIEAHGVDALVVLRFDAAFAAMSAGDFVSQVLARGLAARHVVVGYDFVFGHGRAGNAERLAAMAPEHGFALSAVEAVAAEGEVYSSSRIRVALENANPGLATELLGHWWEMEGRVVGGARRGHQLGFPTANLRLRGFLQPALGIYAVRAGLSAAEGVAWRDGVASFGRRPTFGGTEPVLEIHLFDFAGDLYGRHMRVAFVDYIREEKKFDDIEELKREMASDCEIARGILAAAAGEGRALRLEPAARRRARP